VLKRLKVNEYRVKANPYSAGGVESCGGQVGSDGAL